MRAPCYPRYMDGPPLCPLLLAGRAVVTHHHSPASKATFQAARGSVNDTAHVIRPPPVLPSLPSCCVKPRRRWTARLSLSRGAADGLRVLPYAGHAQPAPHRRLRPPLRHRLLSRAAPLLMWCGRRHVTCQRHPTELRYISVPSTQPAAPVPPLSIMRSSTVYGEGERTTGRWFPPRPRERCPRHDDTHEFPFPERPLKQQSALLLSLLLLARPACKS